jgi:hypothetical protein
MHHDTVIVQTVMCVVTFQETLQCHGSSACISIPSFVAACVNELRNAYKIRVNLKKRHKFVCLCIYGSNVKVGLKEMRCMSVNWIQPASDVHL